MIVVLDYGMGNVGSVLNMLVSVGAEAVVSCDGGDLTRAHGFILPGVGAFDAGVRGLRNCLPLDLLEKRVQQEKIPLLGICLGMQLLTRCSEEGTQPGLGWVDAETKRFQLEDRKLRVPHMGWNFVAPSATHSPLQVDSPNRFYFVHSYYVECANAENILCTTNYGGNFTSGIVSNNIFGLQFHPEKSHRYGKQVLRKFSAMCSC